MCRSEALRILAAHSRRTEVVTYLNEHGWDSSYDSAVKYFGDKWLDYELFKNIVRSGEEQATPVVSWPVLPLSKFSNWPTRERVVVRDGLVTVTALVLVDRVVDVVFRVPEKLLRREFVKWCLPNVRVDRSSGVVCFDFCVVEGVVVDDVGVDSVLACDPGVLRPSVCARVYGDGRLSEEFGNSVETERSVVSARRLEGEIELLVGKERRRAALGFCDVGAQRELVRLRGKLRGVNDHVVWNAAHDVVNHARPGEVIGVENNKFSQGLWRGGELRLALEHVALRRGFRTVLYSARDASHTCPVDDFRVVPVDRVSSCDCGWVGDRDYTAAAVGGVRTARKVFKRKKLSARVSVSRQKSVPTSKRPRRKSVRFVPGSVVPGNVFGGNAFTRAVLSVSTDGLRQFSPVASADQGDGCLVPMRDTTLLGFDQVSLGIP